MSTRRRLLAVLLGLLVAGTAPAEEAPAQEPAAEQKPAPPTGWAVQGLPILNYNTDQGLGYGALLMFLDRADGTWQPFRYSILLQFFQTTGGVMSHMVVLDAPRFLGSPWRVGVKAVYGRSKFQPYYGLGNTAEYVPAFSTCDNRDVLADNPDVCPGNPDFKGLRYYTYDQQTFPRIHLDVRRELAGPWRLYLGYRLRFEQVLARYGAGDLGQSGDSKLMEDAAAGLLVGYDGRATDSIPQRTAELTAGVQYDTRDIESAPTLGMYHELSVRGAASFLGSGYDYWGAALHLRAFHPVVPGYRGLVAGWRALFDVTGGRVPFTQLYLFGGLNGQEGVGGVYSTRGILKNRFQGPAKLLLNAELRWTPFPLSFSRQQLDFTLVGFVDAGRAWRDLRFQEGGGLKAAVGGGLHFAWNREFIIRADYGVGLTEPSTGFYLEFGQMF